MTDGLDFTALPTTAIQALLQIEPDIRLLDGLITVLHQLSEPSGSIPPTAIAAIAISAEAPVSRMTELRRSVTVALRLAQAASQNNVSTDAQHG